MARLTPLALSTLRNRVRNQPGIPTEVEWYPDAVLIDTLVKHGQPRWAANEVRTNPMVRLAAIKFQLDVDDSNEGDKEARQRIEFMQAQWAALRREELLSDQPDRMFTDVLDPRTLI